MNDDITFCPLCCCPLLWESLPAVSTLVCLECQEGVRYHRLIERWTINGISYTQDEIKRVVKLKAFL
jgi:hypothetical protein